MTETLQSAKATLQAEAATCVVLQKGQPHISHERGIKPILDLLRGDPAVLCGASVADRVIGKAAALLMVYGQVAEVYTAVISEHAAAVFEAAGVPFCFDEQVPFIINRDGTGMCPMEQRCLTEQIDDPQRAFEVFDHIVPR